MDFDFETALPVLPTSLDSHEKGATLGMSAGSAPTMELVRMRL